VKHYDFAKTFHSLYDQAVLRYAQGKRGTGTFFSNDEIAFLAANGITAQHLYDYAEDHHGYNGEPGFEIALSIELIRRDYFLNVQHGKPSASILDERSLPAKNTSARGIAWLPRIIPKAKAKLRGELPPSIMYGCGGDRQFLQQHDIHPAELLSLIWRHFDDDDAIIDWVATHSALNHDKSRR
jgi:hypothetical protein